MNKKIFKLSCKCHIWANDTLRGPEKIYSDEVINGEMGTQHNDLRKENKAVEGGWLGENLLSICRERVWKRESAGERRDGAAGGEWVGLAPTVPSLWSRGIDGAGAACCIQKSSLGNSTSPENQKLRQVSSHSDTSSLIPAADTSLNHLLPNQWKHLFDSLVVWDLWDHSDHCRSESRHQQMMKMQQHSHIVLALILAVFIFRIALSGPSVVRGRWSLHLSYCHVLKNQRRGKLLIAWKVRYLLHILMSDHCGFLHCSSPSIV